MDSSKQYAVMGESEYLTSILSRFTIKNEPDVEENTVTQEGDFTVIKDSASVDLWDADNSSLKHREETTPGMKDQITVTSKHVHDKQVQITAEHPCNSETEFHINRQVCITEQQQDGGCGDIATSLAFKASSDKHKYGTEVSEESMFKITDVRTLTVEGHEGASSGEQSTTTSSESRSPASQTECAKANNPVNHSRKNSSVTSFKCNDCDKYFSCAQTLRNHAVVHTREKPFQCDVCGKAFGLKCYLMRHRKMHSEDQLHQCRICGKTFALKDSLTKHKRIHTEDNPYKYKICGKSFCSNGNLIMHNLIHTGEKPFKCEVCAKSFRRKARLNTHKCKHTGDNPCEWKNSKTGSDTYATEASEKSMLKITGVFTLTREVHERVNSCEQSEATNTEHTSLVCRTEFANANNSVNHSRKMCGKIFKCKDCDKCFTSVKYLRNHVEIHRREKPFQCEVCGKAFGIKLYLIRHSLIHTGEKPHQCKICGKAYALRCRLTTHEHIHTGKKNIQMQSLWKVF